MENVTLSTSNAPLRPGQRVRLTARPEGGGQVLPNPLVRFCTAPSFGGAPFKLRPSKYNCLRGLARTELIA